GEIRGRGGPGEGPPVRLLPASGRGQTGRSREGGLGSLHHSTVTASGPNHPLQQTAAAVSVSGSSLLTQAAAAAERGRSAKEGFRVRETETSHFWVGRFTEAKAADYFTEVWDENDEDREHTPLSAFARDQGVKWYDHDFIEYGFNEGARSIEEL